MKIVVGSIQQEVNTFSPIRPSKEDFFTLKGEKMLDQIAVTPIFREAGAEIIPTLYANAVPSGKMKFEEYDDMCRELVSMIPDDGDFDGIWLYCHGAMDVEKIGGGELYLLKMIREKVGFDVPIAMALDFHANNDFEIFDYVNVVCGYRTAPHRDMPGTQIRAGQALLRCINEKLLPKTVAVRVPLIISGDMVITDNHPMNKVVPMAIEAEKEDSELIAVNVFHGQNWADVKNGGASVTATAAHDNEKAMEICKKIANTYWSYRNEFKFLIPAKDPEDALNDAISYFNLNKPKAPVFISDSGDNTTAGAAGDRTDIFRLFTSRKDELSKLAKPVLLGGITDKAATELLWGKNVGEAVKVSLGGKLDDTCPAFETTVVVKNKSNILNWDGDGADAGKAVVVDAGGFDAIITENRCALISPEIFASVGLDIYDYSIICVKLGYLYPKLAEVAAHAVLAKTKGGSTVVLDTLDFKVLNKNDFFPFNQNLEYKA